MIVFAKSLRLVDVSTVNGFTTEGADTFLSHMRALSLCYFRNQPMIYVLKSGGYHIMYAITLKQT